jgi:hypothetical protein
VLAEIRINLQEPANPLLGRAFWSSGQTGPEPLRPDRQGLDLLGNTWTKPHDFKAINTSRQQVAKGEENHMQAARNAMCGRAWTRAVCAAATLALAGANAVPAQAKITQLVLKITASPAFGGMSFDTTGQYEQLDGTAYGEIDPDDPANAVIQDISLAPRNANGMVSYSMDVSILKPMDAAKGNHVLLYDVVNRGNKVVPTTFNVGATTANPAGDGFLQRQGYSIVWSGWQGDLVPTAGQLGITVPMASGQDGKPVTGLIRTEFVTVAVPTGPVTT